MTKNKVIFKLVIFFQTLLFAFPVFSFVDRESIKTNAPVPLKPLHLTESVFKMKEPKSISLIAGVPLTGAGDKSGGFGDVASNIQMAFAFKKKFPEMKVQLIIELNQKVLKEVSSVEEIINTLLPSIKTNMFYKHQNLSGVDIFVTPINSSQAVLEASKKGQNLLPKAELSVQYSANTSANENLLKATGEIHFSFSEPGAGQEFLEQGSIFKAGLDGAGIYNSETSLNRLDSRKNVISFLKKNNPEISNHSNLILGYAYTKNKYPAFFYQEAIYNKALLNPDKNYLVLVKKGFENIELKAHNFKIVPVSHFKMSLGHDFIAASDLPPLVTGDSSSATALLTSRPDRLFLYEQLPWKSRYIYDLRTFIQSRMPDIELFNYHINNDSENKENMVNRIFNALTPTFESKFIHLFFNKIKYSKDLASNTLKIYSVYKYFGAHSDMVFKNYDVFKDLINPLFFEFFKGSSLQEINENIDRRFKKSEHNKEQYIFNLLLKKISKVNLSSPEVDLFAKAVLGLNSDQLLKVSQIIGTLLSGDIQIHNIMNKLKQIKNQSERNKVLSMIAEMTKIKNSDNSSVKPMRSCQNLF